MKPHNPIINVRAAAALNSGKSGVPVLVGVCVGVGEGVVFGVVAWIDFVEVVPSEGGGVGVGLRLDVTRFTVTCVAVRTVAPVASVTCNWKL